MALDEQDLTKITEIITAAQGEFLKGPVAKMVNNAITGHVKDIKGEVAKLAEKPAVDPESLGKLLDERMAGLKEELTKAGAKPDGKGGTQQPDPETTKALKELQDANQKLQDKLKARDEADKAEKLRVAAIEEKQAVTTMLGKLGVKPVMVESAFNDLRARGVVTRDADGQIVLKGKDETTGLDANYALEEGLKGWLKTDLGKEFLPPKQAGGTGERGQRGTAGGGGEGYKPMTASEVADALASLD
jgi:hypothetical protein